MPVIFFSAVAVLSFRTQTNSFSFHVTIPPFRPSNGCNVTKGAQAVDRERFIAEIEACSGMMYRVAWSILRNNADCEDALQDAALRAWEKRGRLRDERFFRTWITRILINAWNVICQGQIYPFLDFYIIFEASIEDVG